jgi:ABC-type branched-subunit amino acid transport system substrate-binding protein
LSSSQIDEDSRDFTDVIDAIYKKAPQAIVLAASPSLGARFTNDMSIAKPGYSRNWFFSPSLKTDVFLKNTSLTEIEGGQGVAPQLFEHSEEFIDYYKNRWNEEAPLEGIYFYYDAMMLLSIALERVYVEDPGNDSYDILRDMLFEVANPSGIKSHWDNVAQTMNLIRGGSNVYYSGLTGPLLLFDDGERQLGQASGWIIKSGAIVSQ